MHPTFEKTRPFLTLVSFAVFYQEGIFPAAANTLCVNPKKAPMAATRKSKSPSIMLTPNDAD